MSDQSCGSLCDGQKRRRGPFSRQMDLDAGNALPVGAGATISPPATAPEHATEAADEPSTKADEQEWVMHDAMAGDDASACRGAPEADAGAAPPEAADGTAADAMAEDGNGSGDGEQGEVAKEEADRGAASGVISPPCLRKRAARGMVARSTGVSLLRCVRPPRD
jgi:hypothetical protein